MLLYLFILEMIPTATSNTGSGNTNTIDNNDLPKKKTIVIDLTLSDSEDDERKFKQK